MNDSWEEIERLLDSGDEGSALSMARRLAGVEWPIRRKLKWKPDGIENRVLRRIYPIVLKEWKEMNRE